MELARTPHGVLLVGYPLLPWWAMMALGWDFGRWIVRMRESGKGVGELGRPLVYAGLAGLGVFALVRGLNAYGNMRLFRADSSLLQWLHLSKYPPSLAYTALELGIMALLLAALYPLCRWCRGLKAAQPESFLRYF